MSDGGSSFRLVSPIQNPGYRLIVGGSAVLAPAASMAVWVCFAFGWLTANGAIFVTATALIAPFAFGAIFFPQYRGSVRVDADGFTLTTRAGIVAFLWRDVDGIDLRAPSKLPDDPTGFSGGSYVEVKLRRVPRVGILPGRSGTDVTLGVPKLFTKSVRLYVLDPAGFVRAAGRYVAV